MKKRVILISVILFLIVLISFYFDNQIVQVVSLLRNNFFNDFFLGITFVSSEIIIFFVLTTMFLYSEHKRKWILPLWLTLLSSAIVSLVLKSVIRRERPFQLNIVQILPLLESAIYNLKTFSFPSFQSMLVFCAIPILSKEFPRTKKIWIVFAVLVAFSRIYFGAHFLSDVLAGGIIGYLLGVMIIKLEDKYKFGEKTYNYVKTIKFSKK